MQKAFSLIELQVACHPKSRQCPGRRKATLGFSLIELLVVIGIISILSAIAVPNFMAARERARDAARKSDLKNMQSALELYKQDQPTSSYPQQLTSLDYFSTENIGQCWYNGPANDDFADSCPTDKTIYMKKLPQDPASTTASPVTYFYQSNGDQAYTLIACLENKADSEGVACSSTCPVGLCYTLTEP